MLISLSQEELLEAAEEYVAKKHSCQVSDLELRNIVVSWEPPLEAIKNKPAKIYAVAQPGMSVPAVKTKPWYTERETVLWFTLLVLSVASGLLSVCELLF